MRSHAEVNIVEVCEELFVKAAEFVDYISSEKCGCAAACEHRPGAVKLPVIGVAMTQPIGAATQQNSVSRAVKISLSFSIQEFASGECQLGLAIQSLLQLFEK